MQIKYATFGAESIEYYSVLPTQFDILIGLICALRAESIVLLTMRVSRRFQFDVKLVCYLPGRHQ